MKIALAQLNPTVGDLDANLEKLKLHLAEISQFDTDLIILPELFLTGYPPRDLLDDNSFIDRCEQTLTQLIETSRSYPKTAILIGTVTRCRLKHGKKLYNSAVLIENGEVLFTQNKTLLPAYDVFDENRYFEPSKEVRVCPFRGEILGISICEDAWNEDAAPLPHLYEQNPLSQLSSAGATLFLNLSASPYYLGKEQIRLELLTRQSQQYELPLLMVNQVGGNDELIFDGCSLALNNSGQIVSQASQFSEEILYIDSLDLKQSISPEPSAALPTRMAQLESALILGIRDYFQKCGFSETIIGLSGGIDSALTCALAVKALGPDKVWGVTMPSHPIPPAAVLKIRGFWPTTSASVLISYRSKTSSRVTSTLSNQYLPTCHQVLPRRTTSASVLISYRSKTSSRVTSTPSNQYLPTCHQVLPRRTSRPASVVTF